MKVINSWLLENFSGINFFRKMTSVNKWLQKNQIIVCWDIAKRVNQIN